eukprot:4922973-Pyramimonas_sp.AAC.1
MLNCHAASYFPSWGRGLTRTPLLGRILSSQDRPSSNRCHSELKRPWSQKGRSQSCSSASAVLPASGSTASLAIFSAFGCRPVASLKFTNIKVSCTMTLTAFVPMSAKFSS